ncbi:MAG: DUF3426 domain-containing protein [Pseudomonadota bacterium]
MSRAPSFLREPAPRRPRRGEWLVLVALGVLLLAQVLIAEHARLAADPRWRPLLEKTCDILRCRLPPWREPAAFTMLSRDVIAIPERAGVLRVQASIRNDARWAQPWPVLGLSLSDASGRLLGTRRFQPGEYLGSTAGARTLGAGQAAQLSFDIIEPAPGVVAFDFRFE